MVVATKKMNKGYIMIPIYRAKKIDSDEYVEGMLGQYVYGDLWIKPINKTGISSKCRSKWFDIDPSTLAIHFPDMIDSEGTKIFASLSEDGKGGSIFYNSYNKYNMYVKYSNGRILMPVFDCEALTNRLDYRVQELNMHSFRLQNTIKVTGIKERYEALKNYFIEQTKDKR